MELVGSNSSFQWMREISNFPVVRQLGFLAGLSASIALGVSVVLWSQSKDYVPLYMDLSLQGASEVVDSLERSNTPFRMDPVTGTIQVPSDQVQRLRMQLAAEGLPAEDGKGFAILNNEPQLGLSGFMEQARYDHALEQELAETVSTIENVRSARVHLAVPKNSGFIRKSGRPAASVLVNLYPGRELGKRQLAGITNLVAASVPEMLPEDVSVVDQEGRLLSDRMGDGISASIDQLEIVRTIEQNYVDRILEILVPIAGRAGVRTQVNADIDFTSFESTSESYLPDSSVRSEQIEQESNTSSEPNGGVPGTLANQPPDNPDLGQQNAQGILRDSESRSNSSRTVRNYEVGKTISHQRQAPGALQRLTVAVVLDHRNSLNAEGESVKTPYTQEEIDQLTELVREAVGFNVERGDRVTVSNAAFLPLDALPEAEEASILEAPWVWETARTAVALIVCVLLMFSVIRPILKSSVSNNAQAGQKNLPAVANADANNSSSSVQSANQSMNQGSAISGTGPESSAALAPQSATPATPASIAAPGASQNSSAPLLIQQQQPPLYRHQLDAARELAEQQPETVAHVVKHWVTSDE